MTMNPSPPNWRGLCEELFAAFNTYAVDQAHHDLLWRARALLAQAEPEVRGPSDEELLRLAREWDSGYENIEFVEFIPDFARAVLARWGRPAPAPVEAEVGLTDEELWEMYQGAGTFSPIEFAHAAIAADRARYGRPAPVPAGEVAELVARLRDRQTVPLLEERDRAAALLEQRHPAPVPVAVSVEREGAND